MSFEELKHCKCRKIYDSKEHGKLPVAMFIMFLVFVGSCGAIENGTATSVSYVLLVVSTVALIGMAYATRGDKWEI